MPTTTSMDRDLHMATGAGENSYTKNSRIQVTSLSLSLSLSLSIYLSIYLSLSPDVQNISRHLVLHNKSDYLIHWTQYVPRWCMNQLQ